MFWEIRKYITWQWCHNSFSSKSNYCPYQHFLWKCFMLRILWVLVICCVRFHKNLWEEFRQFEISLNFYKKASSETQGQIVGTRESLNGRENVAQRKVKNGEKSPWGQCFTRPVPNGRRLSGFWLVPEIISQNGGERLELVWWDIVPRGSSRRSLLYIFPPV